MVNTKEPPKKSTTLTVSQEQYNFYFDRFEKGKDLEVISFEQKTTFEVAAQFGNRQLSGYDLLYSNTSKKNSYRNEFFWMNEKPRNGLCLMSTKCVPNSMQKNFLEQTFVLAEYAEKVLPELKKTKFWKMALRSLKNIEKEVELFFEKKEYASVVKLFQRLQINQFFRPNFVEIFNQAVSHNRINGGRLYENEYTWTNTISHSKEWLLYAGCFDSYGLEVCNDYPNVSEANRGVSFICRLDWLKTLV